MTPHYQVSKSCLLLYRFLFIFFYKHNVTLSTFTAEVLLTDVFYPNSDAKSKISCCGLTFDFLNVSANNSIKAFVSTCWRNGLSLVLMPSGISYDRVEVMHSLWHHHQRVRLKKTAGRVTSFLFVLFLKPQYHMHTNPLRTAQIKHGKVMHCFAAERLRCDSLNTVKSLSLSKHVKL